MLMSAHSIDEDERISLAALLDEKLRGLGNLAFRRRLSSVLASLSVRDGETVLDCGCGEGIFTWALSQIRNCVIHAVDLDLGSLKQLNAKTRGNPNISIVQADVTHLPYREGIFDKAICSEVLEHVPSDRLALRELYVSLQKHGTVAITVPNSNYPFFWDPLNKIREYLHLDHYRLNGVFGGIWSQHIRLYSYQEIVGAMESTGFEVTGLRFLTHFCLPFNYIMLYLPKKLSESIPFVRRSVGPLSSSKTRGVASEAIDSSNKFAIHILNFWRRIDSRNDKPFHSGTVPSVSIALTAVKK